MLEKRCFPLYIILSMILQIGGAGNLIIGIATAVEEGGNGKFVFWYQRRNNEVSATALMILRKEEYKHNFS
jgi:hypothetical protein